MCKDTEEYIFHLLCGGSLIFIVCSTEYAPVVCAIGRFAMTFSIAYYILHMCMCNNTEEYSFSYFVVEA